MLGLLLVAWVTVTAWGAAIGENDAPSPYSSSDLGNQPSVRSLSLWPPGLDGGRRPTPQTHEAEPGGADAGPATDPAPDRAGDAAITERASAGSAEGIEDIVQQVFGPQAGAALAVAWCESKLNPVAIGSTGERGLFQVHPIHAYRWPDFWAAWSDPQRNAEYAYELSAGGSNWSPWACG